MIDMETYFTVFKKPSKQIVHLVFGLASVPFHSLFFKKLCLNISHVEVLYITFSEEKRVRYVGLALGNGVRPD